MGDILKRSDVANVVNRFGGDVNEVCRRFGFSDNQQEISISVRNTKYDKIYSSMNRESIAENATDILWVARKKITSGVAVLVTGSSSAVDKDDQIISEQNAFLFSLHLITCRDFPRNSKIRLLYEIGRSLT
ncbi:MAG: hypothetical protein FJX34_05160 [Alphaproteobacteria bacterium]|nr:hypothetical protein [Alphaproteobacteria bacterium]